MSAIVLDTHILIWMLTEPSKLSIAAISAIDQAETTNSPMYVSAISLVEIRYLIEKGKFGEILFQETLKLLEDPNELLTISVLGSQVAKDIEKIDRAIVPDMPDRIIAATSFSLREPLLSADHKIQALSVIKVIW